MNPSRSSLRYFIALAALATFTSSIRAGGVVMFNEIMFHPAGATQELEFVELHNTLSYSMDLSGWKIGGGISYTFPEGTIIPAEGLVVVAKDPDALEAASGLSGALGPFSGQLSNGGETIRLETFGGRMMDEVDYRPDQPWPVAPGGSGASLAKIATHTGSGDPGNWRAGRVGGTPGRHNFGSGGAGEIVETTLVSTSAVWKYRDLGTDPGNDWMTPEYNDGIWSEGASPLGYDDSWITTTVSYGPNSSDKHPTTYFRHHFELSGVEKISSLQFSAMMDDGAILYLNGSEFARVRMNGGTVSHLDYANDAISGSEENRYESLVLPLNLLQEGENVLAVELHQQEAGSSDLTFSAELIAIETLAPPDSDADLLDPPELVINEVAGVSGSPWWIEFKNPGTSSFDPAGYVLSVAGDPAREQVLSGEPIPGGGLLVLGEADLGFTVGDEEPVFLYRPGGESVVDAKVSKLTTRGLMEDRWLVVSAATPGEANTFDLNEDVVINEIMYHHQGDYTGELFVPSDVEWLELYNRGGTAADLTGWKIEGGISYDFPNGTMLAPGAYLVVDGYSGSLSNRNELIVLEDALGNPADEVHYFDGGRWPEYADGGGSSLELRDPWADNSEPEAWAPSDESQDSNWQTYTFEAVANPSSIGPDNQWMEFIFGLLDAGEVLIDDISVLEDPAGAAAELISDGDFESGVGAWRIIGNHRHSEVIADPENGGNQVLRLVAVGATEHLHNHAEITLANGQSVENGTVYRVSFRAKWIAGSRLLNTRLYFNRTPKTHVLEAPTNNGTPGAVNSAFASNIGPTFDGLKHDPVLPGVGEAVTVSVDAADPQGITSMVLRYSVAGGSWQQAAMTADGSGRFSATLPGQGASTIVQFYAEGTDGSGASSTFPAEGPNSRALYMVNDGQSDPRLHNFRIIMTEADSNFMHTGINSMSNEHMPCTVISRDQDIYYNAGVHLKGSLGGRESDTKTGYRIRFNKDQLFNGVLDTVAIDKSSLNDLSRMPETFTFLAMNRAGSDVTKYNDWIKVIAPKTARTNAAQLQLGHYSNVNLERQFENGSDGGLFEFEYVYYQVAADSNGNKTSSGRSTVRQSMDSYSGTNKEDYRQSFLIKNNRESDDYTGLMDFVDVMGSSGDPFNSRIADVADVDQWLRSFAFAVANGCRDNFSVGSYHNAYFYRRASDGRFLYIPHDMDQSHSSPSLVPGNEYLERMIAADPDWERRYYMHMQDILDHAWNSSYLQRWANEFSDLMPSGASNFSGFLSNIGSFSSSLVSQLGSRVAPQYPFAVTFGLQFVEGLAAPVFGEGWIDLDEIRLEGQDAPLDLVWSATGSGSNRKFSWFALVPVQPGVNSLELVAYDRFGNSLGSESITVTSNAMLDPLRDHLRITEIMVNPVGGSDYEFIELTNTGDSALDLTGVYFSEGIDFDFSIAGFTGLGAGESCVAVSNLAAFSSRYDTAGMNVAGVYAGKLANEGETLTILGAFGNEILSFDYQTGRGWPVAADGAGHSMVPIDSAIATQSEGSIEYGGNWRASADLGGSPGAADPTPPPSVVINEIIVNTTYDDPSNPDHDSNDVVELYNPLATPVVLGPDWYLSDDPDQLDQWAIPEEMTLPAREFIAFDEVSGFHHPITSGFGLDQNGEQLFLSYLPTTGAQRVVDAIRFKAQEPDVSLGRYGDGGSGGYSQAPTAGLANTRPGLHPVISEIMYRPPDSPTNNTLDEFIEIHNPGDSPVELWNESGSWRIDGGVGYDFPANTTLEAGGSLVLVTFDPADSGSLASFLATYGLSAGEVSLMGPLSGTLDNRGERIALERPQASDQLGDPVSWVIVDEVIYFDSAPWPSAADGTGKSLQRKFTRWSGNDPSSWYASFQPSPGRDSEHYGPQGVPDWWLAGQDPAWSADFEAAATTDHDDDGQTAGEEFVAGTHPLIPGSVINLEAGEGGFEFMTLAAGPEYNGLERYYSLKWSESLESWGDNPLPEWNDILGDGSGYLVPVPFAGYHRGFFAIEAKLEE